MKDRLGGAMIIAGVIAMLGIGVAHGLDQLQCDRDCAPSEGRLIDWECHCETEDGWNRLDQDRSERKAGPG